MGFRNKELTNQEKYVIDNWQDKTYKVMGQELGVSAGRVRQILVKAERKIREKEKEESNRQRI